MEYLISFLLLWGSSLWALYQLGRKRERHDLEVMIKVALKTESEEEGT